LTRLVQSLGASALDQLAYLGRMGLFLVYMFRGIVKPPGKFWSVIKQIQFIGTKSFFVIGFTAAFTGMVLGLQGYYTLSKFGSEGLLGAGVAISLIRELGPVLSALMVTGRAGSAICAEIGLMRIDEQIDAIDWMGIVKSLGFAVLMIWICTYKGFYAGVDEGNFGPEQVSRATTNAVVLSSVSILAADYVVTSILL